MFCVACVTDDGCSWERWFAFTSALPEYFISEMVWRPLRSRKHYTFINKTGLCFSVVKTTALKQQMSELCLHVQCTEASFHIYSSRWPVTNVKVNFCAQNVSDKNFDICCFKTAAFQFPVLQGSAWTLSGETENYAIFQLPIFCETFLPKIIEIPRRVLELWLQMSVIYCMRLPPCYVVTCTHN